MLIRTKLRLVIIAAAVVVIAAGGVIGVLVLHVNEAVVHNDEAIVEANDSIFPALEACTTMKLAVVEVQNWFTDASATHFEDGFDEADAWRTEFYNQVAVIRGLHADEEEHLAVIEGAFDPYYAKGNVMARTYIDEGIDAGNLLMGEFDAEIENVNGLVDELLASFQDEYAALMATIQENQLEIDAKTHQLVIAIIVTIVFLALVIAGFAYLLNHVVRPLGTLARAATTMGGGDFSVKLKDTKSRTSWAR